MSTFRSSVGLMCLFIAVPAAVGHPPDSKILTDIYGDPLPPNAIARMGTTRLRHGKSVLDYTLTPDGKRVMSFSAEGALVEWDANSSKELRRWMLAHGPFITAALSADRKLLATIGNEDASLFITAKTNRTVRLWDTVTGKQIRKITDDANTTGGIAISRDAKTLATMSQGHVIHLWEIPSGKLLHRLDGAEPLRQFPVPPLAFSPDGEVLLSGGKNLKIFMWNTRKGKKVREIVVPDLGKPNPVGMDKHVANFAFSRDGKRFASVGFRQDIFVWDATNGTEIRRFETTGYHDLAFSSDGRCLVLAGKDDILCERDITTGKELQQFSQGRQPTFSSDGTVLAMFRGTSIALWDVVQRKERSGPMGHTSGLSSVAISPDGKTLATAGIDGFRLWDFTTGNPRGGPFSPRHRDVAFSPDGKTIASVGLNGFLRTSDAATGKEIRQFSPHKFYSAYALAFRPDGTIVTAGGPPNVCLTDPATGTVIPFAEEQTVTAMAVSPNGERMVSNWRGGPIVLWDLNARKMILQIPKPLSLARVFTYSADGAWFASADVTDGGPVRSTEERSVYLHVAATGKEVRQFGKGPHPYRAVAFSRDGRILAAGSDAGIIRLWELWSGQERQSLSGHTSGIQSLAFHPDGSLISGSEDCTALVWNVTAPLSSRELKPAELDALWTDLAKDAAKAHFATRTFIADPNRAVLFLGKQVQPVKAIPADRLASLIKDLAGNLEQRNKAAAELESLGDLAGDAMKKAIASNLPLEHTRRIRQLLEKLPGPITAEQLRDLRTVEALERIGTPDARQVLAMLAKGAHSARLTQEARAALERLEKNAKTQ